MNREALNDLVALLDLDSKKEVARYCRNLVITSEALVGIVLAAEIGSLGPYAYASHAREISAEALEPRKSELTALAKAGVGQLSGAALKAVRKIDQQFLERSLLVVHLFYSRSHKYWHMFYFDQRDYGARKNHWKHGPHIRYARDSSVRVPLQVVWQRVFDARPKFPPSVHVRFSYHHNRARNADA